MECLARETCRYASTKAAVLGWENEGKCQNVTAELFRAGYSERETARGWSGNFLKF
ncbi:MAG: dipeptidase [Acidobacteriota bacterium]|nr:dipeptidase [Acidobacteriota bacterium]